MIELPDLSPLTHSEKDALIRALWAQVQALTARVAELEARLGMPPKTPSNSSLPPCKGRKLNRPEKAKRHDPPPGSVGRMGGGRALAVFHVQPARRSARCTVVKCTRTPCVSATRAAISAKPR